MVSLGAKVDSELKQEIRVKAAKEGMTMSEYIRGVLRDSVDD